MRRSQVQLLSRARILKKMVSTEIEKLVTEVRMQYEPRLRKMLKGKFRFSHDVCDEVIQEMYVKLLEHPYDSKRSGPYTWTYRIAYNNAINRIRKKKVYLEGALGVIFQLTVERRLWYDPSLEDREAEISLESSLQNAMPYLSAEQQRVLQMRFDDLSTEEIMSATGKKRKTVTNTLGRARAKVVKTLNLVDPRRKRRQSVKQGIP